MLPVTRLLAIIILGYEISATITIDLSESINGLSKSTIDLSKFSTIEEEQISFIFQDGIVSTGINENFRFAGRNRILESTQGGVTFIHIESDDKSTLNVVRKSNGKTFASINDATKGEVVQIGIDANGKSFATMTPIGLFAPEGDPVALKVTNTFSISTPKHDIKADITMEDGSSIDVMVVWTKRAECKNSNLRFNCKPNSITADNMMGRIQLAVEETNQAFRDSGVKTEINLVHSYRHETYVETGFARTLHQISHPSDGQLDDVHDKRALYGADMVSMFIDNTSYCGLGWVGPAKDIMFSLTSWSCATGYYSFGHELAHNMGCNHDLGSEGACTDSDPINDYAYGYRDPNARFRTIMAYDCTEGQCDDVKGQSGCPRIQRFSNPDQLYLGNKFGAATANNVKKMNEMRVTIANYFPHQDTALKPSNPITVPMSSPSSIPTSDPTTLPSSFSTLNACQLPSPLPSSSSTSGPSSEPITLPSLMPTSDPSLMPISSPSLLPTSDPSPTPTSSPSALSTSGPSSEPTTSTSLTPTSDPILMPTYRMTKTPTPSRIDFNSISVVISPEPSILPSYELTSLSLSPSSSPTLYSNPTVTSKPCFDRILPFNVTMRLIVGGKRIVTTRNCDWIRKGKKCRIRTNMGLAKDLCPISCQVPNCNCADRTGFFINPYVKRKRGRKKRRQSCALINSRSKLVIQNRCLKSHTVRSACPQTCEMC